eukprot:1159279-Pelagomonas_calceolata.AAC.21
MALTARCPELWGACDRQRTQVRVDAQCQVCGAMGDLEHEVHASMCECTLCVAQCQVCGALGDLEHEV